VEIVKLCDIGLLQKDNIMRRVGEYHLAIGLRGNSWQTIDTAAS